MRRGRAAAGSWAQGWSPAEVPQQERPQLLSTPTAPADSWAEELDLRLEAAVVMQLLHRRLATTPRVGGCLSRGPLLWMFRAEG